MSSLGERLQAETIGVKLERRNLRLRLKMSDDQLAKTALVFMADPNSVTGGRKLINSRHELVAPVLSLLLSVRYYVRDRSVLYPGERGVRLTKVANVESMTKRIEQYKEELRGLLEELDKGWPSVKEEARERLGELYQESDYAELPSTQCGIEVSFPAIAPDERLKKLNPELYEAERRRVSARFEDAAALAEAKAAEQVQELLKHFVDRMKPDAEGKQKVLRASSLENIKAFVEVFRATSIGGNEALEEVVSQVEQLAGNVDVAELRKSDPVKRKEVTDSFERLLGDIDQIVIEQPKREFSFD